MGLHRGEITVATTGHGHMVDLTPEVEGHCSRSGLRRGLVHLFVVGSTAALGTIEFEPGLRHDLPELLDRLAPPERDYRHNATWGDNNGHSHLQATLLGPSITIPLEGGRLVLGTWQQVFLIECDIRPRQRRVVITIVGE